MDPSHRLSIDQLNSITVACISNLPHRILLQPSRDQINDLIVGSIHGVQRQRLAR